MDDAKPIGHWSAPLFAKAQYMFGLQQLLRGCATATDRKQLILKAYERGHLIADEARLLIEAEGLETA